MRTATILLLALPLAAAYEPTPDEMRQIQGKHTELGKRLSMIRAAADKDLLLDAEVHYKAVQWLLRYPEEFYAKNYVAHALAVLDHGLERARELEAGRASWPSRKGRTGRAYRSRVDESIQPYGVSVPASYDGSRPTRLDVVLHGRGATLSEVSFLAQQDSVKPEAIPQDRIELHVFGRTNNAYRWSGETDVFEAIASVKSRYKVDSERVVLRGFSMGGAGTWHIGLHHPGEWVAIEAGAGFTETRIYAKQSNLPSHVERPLAIYDAVEYSRNAFNVPTVGYGGEKDPQLRASQNIQARLADEGLKDLRALFLVGPNTEHRWHPESKKQSEAFIDQFVPAGRTDPQRISFVTYTTRYNQCHWLTIDALERHYDRAQVDGTRTSLTTRNVRRLTVRGAGSIEIDGQRVNGTSFEKKNGKWTTASGPVSGKRHGLQGPIDDAFMDSFVIVKGAGAPNALADRRRQTLERDFAKWLRGDPPMIDDTAVTPALARDKNLVLFGDPSNNSVIRRLAGKLPVKWEPGRLLVLVCPNPEAPSRYVVLNSGHTFGEAEFKGTNALLFPRLGDYAVLDAEGKVVRAGLLDENWRLPK
jgi:dienelactone hydrolase